MVPLILAKPSLRRHAKRLEEPRFPPFFFKKNVFNLCKCFILFSFATLNVKEIVLLAKSLYFKLHQWQWKPLVLTTQERQNAEENFFKGGTRWRDDVGNGFCERRRGGNACRRSND